MPVTVAANGRSVVHKGSNGITTAFPDVCKTPGPGGAPIPIPYPNIAKSSDLARGSTTVKADGQPIALKDSVFQVSVGDEAGSLTGVASGKVKGKAEFVTVSPDVKIEGKGVARAMDLMLQNDRNTPPFPVIQPPMPYAPNPEESECLICGDPI